MKIENRSQRTWPRLNPEQLVAKFLESVPAEHLLGLNRIVLLDEAISWSPRKGDVYGHYIQKRGKEPAYIEIAVGSIYKGIPKIFFYLPLFTKWQLASVLYHEIGHHYGASLHGITAKRKEAFADKYKKKMMFNAFSSWRPLLRPCKPLIRLLSSIVKRLREQRAISSILL